MMIKFFLLACVLSIFTLFFYQLPNAYTADFALQPHHFANETTPIFAAQLATHGVTKAVHAGASVELSDHNIRAFWYGGTREGAKDVAIYSAVFDPQTQSWSLEVPIITRQDTEQATHHYIKKLGNPVAVKKSNGDIWLFYVSVSIGGWSTSAINVTVSKDDGKTWTPPKRLITSPLFNLSNLVKSAPFLLRDGSIGLPVYHELAGKFSEWLKINPAQQVVFKSRISTHRYAIQPAIIPISDTEAISFMRNSSDAPRRVFTATTHDGGTTWSQPSASALRNPNSAVAGIAISANEMILVLNDSEQERDNLSLAYSSDLGKNWAIIARFEDGSEPKPAQAKKIEYSYPYLIQVSNGQYHLLYTWHKTHIKHIHFNQAWLHQKICCN